MASKNESTPKEDFALEILAHIPAAANAMNDLEWVDARKELEQAIEKTKQLDDDAKVFVEELLNLWMDLHSIRYRMHVSGTVENLRGMLHSNAQKVKELVEGLPEDEQYGVTRSYLEDAALSLETSDASIPLHLTLEHLEKTVVKFKEEVANLYEKYKDLTVDELFQPLLLLADLLKADISRRIAKRYGDAQEFALKDADYHRILKSTLTGQLEGFGTAIQLSTQVLRQLQSAFVAIQQLDLDTATTMMEKSKEDLLEAEKLLKQESGIDLNVKIFEAFKDVVQGYRVIVESFESYSSSLYQAIVGDVDAENLKSLQEAEIALPQATTAVARALLIMNQADAMGAKIMTESINSFVINMKNLRRLANSQK